MSIPASAAPVLHRPLMFLALAAATLAAAPAAAQTPDSIAYRVPQSPIVERFDPDSMMAAVLESSGERYDSRRAILYLPADSMDPARARALVDTLDRVVAAVEEIVGGPHPWQRWRHPRVRYYAWPGPLISHTEYGARVFVSWFRVRAGATPWVHETAHAILSTYRDTLWVNASTMEDYMALRSTELMWLQEGLANVIAAAVVERRGLPDYNPFEEEQTGSSHGTCRRYLETEAGEVILPYMAEGGIPNALAGPRRQEVAPAFYSCGQSLTQFLADRHGIAALGALLNEPDGPDALRRLTGLAPEALREAWLGYLEGQAPAGYFLPDT